MSPFGGWGMLTAFLVLLCCRGSGVKAFQGPEHLMVGSGEFQLINCTASCTDPKKLVLETHLNKTLLESQAQWKLFKVANISKDEKLLCSFTCGGRQETKVFNITVFYTRAPPLLNCFLLPTPAHFLRTPWSQGRVWAGGACLSSIPILSRPPFRFPADPPKQVLLTLWPTSVAAGTLFTIECRVPAVAPLEGLTVTLLRGTEILYNHTFVGTAPSPQDAMVSHNTTAHREDGHHNFSCEAQMDLRSHGGGVVHRVSDPQRLEVKEPEPNTQMVIIIAVLIVLLLVFVTFVFLCFVFSQKWHRGRTGYYAVHDHWRRLIGSHRAQTL
ncbi:intercellular adhesion molecule 2 isoform X1 [Ovis aries]|uniref:intercellular adhesion molecule 2 isoform X1 n=1 Tax=Ovis aries TaxID=9940 RepID=UPI00100FC9BF|nr:intercellular adhesion molecule 2 isoform X1 [Ovis aries]XP_060250926.1 intercellular adhesion molecule 2 isoform X1 [Ovis aries]